jgi:quercetin dioxygenase-like cupin family protein
LGNIKILDEDMFNMFALLTTKLIPKAMALMLTISVLFSSHSLAQSKSMATPQREIVLENEHVQVVRLTYPQGTESGMHTHVYANRVVYFVQGGKLMLIPQVQGSDNKSAMEENKILNVTDGQTLFLPATTHNVRNIGNNEIVIVETELKK